MHNEMKKLLFLLAIVLFSCSSDDDNSAEETLVPVNSMHLLFGRWNVTAIKDYNGNTLYSDCDLSELYIDFDAPDDGAIWEKAKVTNDVCGGYTHGYDWWEVRGDEIGYVRLYSQGTGGASYRFCQADLVGDNGLRLILKAVRLQSEETIQTYSQSEQEYYYFVKE